MLDAAITESMNAHLEKKIVKFNRKKHKKDPWMTYGILKSVNHKNKLYKNFMKINKDLPLFDNKKQEFNVYKNHLKAIMTQHYTAVIMILKDRNSLHIKIKICFVD